MQPFLKPYLRYSKSIITLTFVDFPLKVGFRFGEGLRFGGRLFGVRLRLRDVCEFDLKGFTTFTFFPLCFEVVCFFKLFIFWNLTCFFFLQFLDLLVKEKEEQKERKKEEKEKEKQKRAKKRTKNI